MRFGEIIFGDAFFGAYAPDPRPRNATRFGFPLGLTVRGHGNPAFIWRISYGIQQKFAYYHPYNPRTAPQQAWRAVFAAGIAEALLLTEIERALWHDVSPLRGAAPWLLNFMSVYLLANYPPP